MKKTVLLLAITMLIPSFACAEGMLPLQTVLSVGPAPSSTVVTDSNQFANYTGTTGQQSANNGVYEASYTPYVETDPNMVPQNAAAKGQPVPVQKQPRVRIRTKQRSQGNSYWNAGGKGWKSYY